MTALSSRQKQILLLLALSLGSPWGCSTSYGEGGAEVSKGPRRLEKSYTWYDGDRPKKIWLNPELVVEFSANSKGRRFVPEKAERTRDRLLRVNGSPVSHADSHKTRLWKIAPERATQKEGVRSTVDELKAADPQGRYSPVFHTGSSDASARRALPGNVIVTFKKEMTEAEISAWTKSKGTSIVKKLDIGPRVYVLKTGPGFEALEKANVFREAPEVESAVPDWWREVETR